MQIIYLVLVLYKLLSCVALKIKTYSTDLQSSNNLELDKLKTIRDAFMGQAAKESIDGKVKEYAGKEGLRKSIHELRAVYAKRVDEGNQFLALTAENNTDLPFGKIQDFMKESFQHDIPLEKHRLKSYSDASRSYEKAFVGKFEIEDSTAQLQLSASNPEFDKVNTTVTYDEACGDRYNWKCWKKGGHSLDKSKVVPMTQGVHHTSAPVAGSTNHNDCIICYQSEADCTASGSDYDDADLGGTNSNVHGAWCLEISAAEAAADTCYDGRTHTSDQTGTSGHPETEEPGAKITGWSSGFKIMFYNTLAVCNTSPPDFNSPNGQVTGSQDWWELSSQTAVQCSQSAHSHFYVHAAGATNSNAVGGNHYCRWNIDMTAVLR